MALTLYKKKRNFKKTTEPKGKIKRSGKQLIFVIQQHAASHLHYDFRLEMEGVLKSWAVPKGPSLNPEIKRLAMMVEDHPYDYKDFEGNIPEGYGAGNVIVWDNGTYHARSAEGKNETGEKALLAGLKKGHITFVLQGEKLKGEFALVKIHGGKQPNAWLLIKKNDKYASKSDVLKKNKSVQSGRTLNQLEKLSKKKPKEVPKWKSKNSVKPKQEKKVLPAPRKNKALERVTPMKAELGDKAFDREDWIFEIKHDGYRAIANIENEKVDLYSRNFLSFNELYAPIAKELGKIKHTVILDGEVVVENAHGESHFQLLQNYENTRSGNLKYYVFDLLHLNGYDTVDLPLIQRKALLKTLLGKTKMKNIFYSEHVKKDGIAFFESAVENNVEGIIAKDANSPYRVGKCSKEWLKIKIQHQQEAVIAGITEPQGSRKHFGSLVLAVWEDNKWKYIGNCGTGFNDKTLIELYDKLKPLFTDEKPFQEKINSYKKAQWLNPKLVCEIKFSEWTGDGHLRHPVYLGLRKDKKAKEVIRELTPKEMKKESQSPIAIRTKVKKGQKSKVKSQKTEERSQKPEENKKVSGKDYDLEVGKVTLHLTNQNKVYWPKEGFTKKDLIEYYDSVSELILPYLIDRPQSMNRFPNGITGQSFYQKDVDVEKVPAWLKTEKIYSESNAEYIDYLICNDKATLLYMANLGCIEINPWNSRIPKIHNPDWVVIDLDPEEISFKEVVKTALSVKETLDELEIESYCKTSGASGLHIYIPLGAKYDYDAAKNFAELIAHLVNEKLPATTSIIRSPAKRKGKVYLDFLQNRRGQTLAAPYAVRPRPAAPVSTPLLWNEVNDKLDPTAFTMLNTLKRLDKVGDLWKPVLGKGEDISKALKNLEELVV
ncbi:MAG: DNA ligase D [Bacteroidota bacterium]